MRQVSTVEVRRLEVDIWHICVGEICTWNLPIVAFACLQYIQIATGESSTRKVGPGDKRTVQRGVRQIAAAPVGSVERRIIKRGTLACCPRRRHCHANADRVAEISGGGINVLTPHDTGKISRDEEGASERGSGENGARQDRLVEVCLCTVHARKISHVSG